MHGHNPSQAAVAQMRLDALALSALAFALLFLWLRGVVTTVALALAGGRAT